MLHNVQNSAPMVAKDVSRAMQHKRGFAYAYLDGDLNIMLPSENFHLVASGDTEALEGRRLTTVLWEFFGSEADLQAVANGALPVFKLDRINRELPNGEMAYFDFTVVRTESHPPDAALFLLIEDETELGFSQQHLMQERNELQLLQARLLATNRQLDDTLQIKDLFLQMVSHDLRTPLSVIVGYATFLQRNGKFLAEESAGSMLHTIIHQTDRLNYLIEDMITLDRIEKGSIKLDVDRNFVVDSINKVIDALRIVAERKSINMTYHVPEEPIFADYDQQRFWQIAYNLIGNSIKYTPNGGSVDVYTFATQNDFVFEVVDNGYGIAPQDIDHLFELYYRTEEAKIGRTPGSGIGLYIVKKIVDAHSGTIDVESKLNEGSRIRVTLPLLQTAKTDG